MAGTHSNLFVGNLNPDTSEDRLRQVFSSCGAVESCRVVTKDDKTTGFVKMVDVQAAESAIAAMNGVNGLVVKFANFDIGGKQKIYGTNAGANYGAFAQGWGKGSWGKGMWSMMGGCGGMKGGWSAPKLLPREEEPEKPEGQPSENLYVKHLPVGVTEEQIKDTFQKVGTVEECRLLRPDYSLEWAALVRMSTLEQGAAARRTLDDSYPVIIPPEPLLVKLQTKNGAPKDDHCYIKNLPTNATKDKVIALFSKYGEVKWCEVLSPAGKWKVDSSSAALVEMPPEDCQKAIAALDGSQVPYSEIGATIRVRYALNKDRPAAVV
jgi:RNA recognition motif-containing protein